MVNKWPPSCSTCLVASASSMATALSPRSPGRIRARSPARVGERAGDLARILPGERGDNAVAMDDALATKQVEQLGGHLFTIQTSEGVAGRQPDPAPVSYTHLRA